MTRQEILDMPASRELDALVAEKCLGINVTRQTDYELQEFDFEGTIKQLAGYTGQQMPRGFRIKNYSTDLAAAWDALAEKYVFDITHVVMHDGEIYETDIDVNGKSTFQGTGRLSSQELAEAICKAALLVELGLS